MRDRIWESPEQEILARATVREVPIRPGENILDYLERLAVCAGIMAPEDAMRHDPKTAKWMDTEVPDGVREDDGRS